MGDTKIRLFPWGIIVLLLPPLVFFVPRWSTTPPKAPLSVLSKPTWEAKAHGSGGILSLRFDDSGDYLLSSCGGDEWRGVEMWKVPSRRRERAMPVPATVYSLSFSRLGGRPRLLAGTYGCQLFQWTNDDPDASVHQFPVPNEFQYLTGLVTLNEESLAVLIDGDIRIVDYPSWKLVQELEGHTRRVTSIAPFGDDALVSVGEDGRVVLWRRMDGALRIQHSIKRVAMYDSVAVHKESGSIAAVAYGGAVDLFRADEGITLSANISWQGHASIRCLAFTSDGKFLMGAGGNLNCCPGEVMVHEVGKIGIRRWFYAHQGHATAIATGKDPDLFATGGADSMIRLWSLSDVLGPEAEKMDVQN